MKNAIVAVLGGGLWGFVFAQEPLGLEPFAGLAWIALAPLIYLTDPDLRRGPLLGWIHGLVAWIVAVPWIVPTLTTFGGLPTAVSWFLLFLLCAVVLAPAHLVFVWLGRRFHRLGPAAVLIGLPSLWTAIEVVRAYNPTFLAFPWNLAATAWIEQPGALPLSAWIGSFGVSWLLVVCNTALFLAWRNRSWETLAATWLVVASVLAVGERWGSGGQAWSVPVDVSVVQPNHELMPEDGAVIWSQYQGLIETSRAECDAGGGPGAERLLIWPESAGWPLVWERDERLQRDLQDLAERGCVVLLNSPTQAGPAAWSNSALLVERGGAEQRYAKRRLVPFGEMVPLENVLPFVGTLARHAGRFIAGEDAGLISWRDERIATAICYESIFPQDAAEQVLAGATLLATISNDAWYGDSSAPYQLLRAARFRAAENRRPMARAALTGVSALIGADGSIIDQSQLGERAVLRGRLRGRVDVGPWTRRPWVVPVLVVCVTIFLYAAAVSRKYPEMGRRL